MPAIKDLVDAIHVGLGNAWVFSFHANDIPWTPPKPEYICTVTVAESVFRKALTGIVGTTVRLEENVQKLAASCLAVPAFPKLHPLPRIRSRKNRSKGDRERIDIAIHDTKAGVLPAARAVIELKISNVASGLRADLTRNQQLMQLSRPGRLNQLDIAALGFVVVDDKSIGAGSGSKILKSLAEKYARMAEAFLSPDYVTEVSIRQVTPPPADEDDEFVHIISIVITFSRPSTAFPVDSMHAVRFWSTSSDCCAVQVSGADLA